MSKRELWEVVRADQLKVGDVVTYGSPDDYNPYEILSIKEIEGEEPGINDIEFYYGGEFPDTYHEHEMLFRRIPDADDPRVLRRALEIACTDKVDADCGFPDYCIEIARRELESEGKR